MTNLEKEATRLRLMSCWDAAMLLKREFYIDMMTYAKIRKKIFAHAKIEGIPISNLGLDEEDGGQIVD